jgi:arylsulfatase
MEVYAAYLAETDYEIGRLVQAFKDTGRYDNTLIIYIHGDNGASGEGTPEGSPSEADTLNSQFPTVEEYGPKYLDKWGSEYTDPHYPVAWAWALNTPFKWTKQVSSYFGGTKNGMVISWPGHINDPGGLRNQFHHVVDIVPTILEACGIVEPDMVDGVKQNPIEGVSLAYTFDKANANAPSTHHSQYFEMFGAMGMYNDGWMASTDPFAIPWLVFGSNKPVEDVWSKATWHLYHVTEDDDWTQYTDVKEKNPDKLKQLQDLFANKEAPKNNIFPLNNYTSALNARTSLIGTRATTVYHPGIVALDPYD